MGILDNDLCKINGLVFQNKSINFMEVNRLVFKNKSINLIGN